MKHLALMVTFLFVLLHVGHSATLQSTMFTYQGNLSENNQPANGIFDLTFSLFDDASAGNQVGTTVQVNSYQVTNGLITTDLDFPGVFTGNQLWLEVTVGGQTLSPRQAVNTVPVAQFALKGIAIASPWDSGTAYSQGSLVTGGAASKTLFMALQSSTAMTPGAAGSEAFWTVVSTGTGAAPVGIPYTMVTHQASGSQFYSATTPAVRPYSLTLNSDVMTYIPTDCTPSLSVYSLTGDSIAVTFYVATLPAVAGGFSIGGGTLGTPCSLTSTSTTVPATCSATGSAISAGSFATIWAFGTSETGTIFTAFSCN